MTLKRQIPGIVIPIVAPTGTETESIQDALAHDSRDLAVWAIQEKIVQVFVTEIVTGAGPGILQCSIWLSPDGTNYTQLAVPTNIVPTGVTLTAQSIILPWTTHSEFALVRLQAVAASATDFWMAVALLAGKK